MGRPKKYPDAPPSNTPEYNRWWNKNHRAKKPRHADGTTGWHKWRESHPDRYERSQDQAQGRRFLKTRLRIGLKRRVEIQNALKEGWKPVDICIHWQIPMSVILSVQSEATI